MATMYNPWAAKTYAPKPAQSGVERARDSGDFGLGGLQAAFGSDPPQVDGNTATLGQMGARAGSLAKYAGDAGMVIDPVTGQARRGLSNEDMDAYLGASGSDMGAVGGAFSPAGAMGAGRTADQIGNAALTRAFNPFEATADPTADVGQMMAQRDYLRQVAAGGNTAAQEQLKAGLQNAQASQASISAGVRGAQAAAARRASGEAQLDIRNQGVGQMQAQQAADVQGAQGQLQGLNQAISQGLGQRQDLLATGQAGDAAVAVKNQAVQEEALRTQLANLATRNDLTAEQKQQMMQQYQARAQADRMATTYGLRGVQMAANRNLNGVNTSTGQAANGGAVSDRVSMANYVDSTERGAATMGAIGAGAGMAIRGLARPSAASPSTGSTYAGPDVRSNPNAGLA